MIDNITIVVDEKLNIEKLDLTVCQKSGYNRYRIFGHDEIHYLEFWCYGDNIKIQGSWRKWYLGSKSLSDLTRTDLFQVCQELSVKTGISKKALLEAKVTSVEFGLNFNLPIPPTAILNNMEVYSTSELGRFPTSVSFRKNDYWLIAYDKEMEISKLSTHGKTSETKVLRMELKVFRRTAFREKLRAIETVKDIIANYRNLIISLYHEIRKIEIMPLTPVNGNVSFEGQKIFALTNFMKYVFMKNFGLKRTLEFLDQLDMIASNKSVIKKRLKQILSEYDEKAEFTRNEFLKTIRMQLVSKLSEVCPEYRML